MAADREGSTTRRDEAVQVESENGAHVLCRRQPVPSAPVRRAGGEHMKYSPMGRHSSHALATRPPSTPPRWSSRRSLSSEGGVWGGGGHGTRRRPQRARRVPALPTPAPRQCAGQRGHARRGGPGEDTRCPARRGGGHGGVATQTHERRLPMPPRPPAAPTPHPRHLHTTLWQKKTA